MMQEQSFFSDKRKKKFAESPFFSEDFDFFEEFSKKKKRNSIQNTRESTIITSKTKIRSTSNSPLRFQAFRESPGKHKLEKIFAQIKINSLPPQKYEPYPYDSSNPSENIYCGKINVLKSVLSKIQSTFK